MRLALQTYDNGQNDLWSIDGKQCSLNLGLNPQTSEHEFYWLKAQLLAAGSKQFSCPETPAEYDRMHDEIRASGWKNITPTYDRRWFGRCAMFTGVEVPADVAEFVEARRAK